MKKSKLVRDKIPQIILDAGKTPTTHIADSKEYSDRLKDKLLEETNEFITDPNQEELSDILEVIRAICASEGWDLESIEELRKQKEQKRGGFKEKIVLDKIE